MKGNYLCGLVNKKIKRIPRDFLQYKRDSFRSNLTGIENFKVNLYTNMFCSSFNFDCS